MSWKLLKIFRNQLQPGLAKYKDFTSSLNINITRKQYEDNYSEYSNTELKQTNKEKNKAKK